MSDNRGNRDEFTAQVKRTLEQQAGSRCCNPGCCQPTRAQSWDGAKSINIGTAAHIHAAAEGGARFDPNMQPEERKAADNGIWMCRNCGTLIDADEGGFPAEVLRTWKQEVLEERRADVTAPARRLHQSAPTDADGLGRQSDIQRYEEFINELPSDGGVVDWLRTWQGGAPYDRSLTDRLETFVRRWVAPERAFNSPRIQAVLTRLTKSLRLFLNRVYIDTFPIGNSECSRVPSDWHHENRARWDEAVQAIEAHMNAAVDAHVELIQVAKEELGT